MLNVCRPDQNQDLMSKHLHRLVSGILHGNCLVACPREDTMSDFLQMQRLKGRQAASSEASGDPGSNTFLDLISDPFVAAVSRFLFLRCIDCPYLTPSVPSECLLGIPRYFTGCHCSACSPLLLVPSSTFPCVRPKNQTRRCQTCASADRERHLLMVETCAEN